MEESIAQLMQYERVLDPLDNGNEFDYWIEYVKRMESRTMKYIIDLTDKQKKQMDCILEIVNRYVGFNPKLEPIKTTNIEDSAAYKKGLEDARQTLLTLLAIPSEEYTEVFNDEDCYYVRAILSRYSIPEIEKEIKAYEEKKKAEEFRETFPFKLGDVVIHKEKPIMGIVIGAWQQKKREDNWIDGVRIITRNTEILEFKVDEMYRAEGRHYDIESILKELGE